MDYKENVRLRCMTPLDMVKEFRVTMGQEKDPDRSENLVKEEYQEWLVEAEPCFNSLYYCEKELKELADLVYVCYGYADAMGWDLDEALRRVHRNNLDRCVWPDGTIKRREDGKILKSPDAKPVDLGDLT